MAARNTDLFVLAVIGILAASIFILDLPIPAGFAIKSDQLAELVGSKKIEKFQISDRRAVVYLRGLEPNKPLVLNYDLLAKTPVKVAVPAARVYEYYNPDKQAVSGTKQLTVTAKGNGQSFGRNKQAGRARRARPACLSLLARRPAPPRTPESPPRTSRPSSSGEPLPVPAGTDDPRPDVGA